MTAFFNDIQTAVSGLSTQPDVGRKNNDDGGEDLGLPNVSYDVLSFPLSYNNGSKKKPSDRERDSNGNVTALFYQVFFGLRFDIEVAAVNDDQLSPIYEAVLGHFLAYETWKDDTDLHPAVNDITVTDGDNADDPSKESTIRGDKITVEIEWIRKLRRDVSHIAEIDIELDIDGDGTPDKTYYVDGSS